MKPLDGDQLQAWVNELEEEKSWAHHVGDLDSGQLLTSPLDRPVAPLSRARRLSQLGRLLDASIFGGAAYDLTPHRPYKEFPPAGLSVSGAAHFDVFRGTLVWAAPEQESPAVFRQMHATLTVSPFVQHLVSIYFSAKAWPGRSADLSIFVTNSGRSVSIPIDAYVSHAVDLTFTPTGNLAGLTMVLRAGIQLLNFDVMRLVELPPMLDPG